MLNPLHPNSRTAVTCQWVKNDSPRTPDLSHRQVHTLSTPICSLDIFAVQNIFHNYIVPKLLWVTLTIQFSYSPFGHRFHIYSPQTFIDISKSIQVHFFWPSHGSTGSHKHASSRAFGVDDAAEEYRRASPVKPVRSIFRHQWWTSLTLSLFSGP
jgi:hypothetical protein